MFHNSFMNSKQVLALENSNKVDDKWQPLKVLIHFLFMQIGSEIQKGKKKHLALKKQCNTKTNFVKLID